MRSISTNIREWCVYSNSDTGLTVQTGIANPAVVPGEEMKLTHTATISSDVPVKWVATKYPSISRDAADVIELHAKRESFGVSVIFEPRPTCTLANLVVWKPTLVIVIT